MDEVIKQLNIIIKLENDIKYEFEEYDIDISPTQIVEYYNEILSQD